MEEKKQGWIIDVKSMQNITLGGKQVSMRELFQLTRDVKVLLWNSEAGKEPIPYDPDKTSINVIDITKASEEELDELYEQYIKE